MSGDRILHLTSHLLIFSIIIPPYNVVVAPGQGTRPLSAVNATLMQVSLAHDGLTGSSATALGS